MKLEYSRRALADLQSILEHSRREFGGAVATALQVRLLEVIDRICRTPNLAPIVEHRPGVRVVSLIRYPYRVFYRIADETVRVLHVRHTSRSSW